jgi:hypothetical protein
MLDDELEVLAICSGALDRLDEEKLPRALTYLVSRYAKDLPITLGGKTADQRGTSDDLGKSSGVSSETLAELFDAANPKSEKEKALVAAYWVQFSEGEAEFQSQIVNAKLRDLGHQIKNITDAFSQLQDEKPARLVQLKKSGSSKQARKTYKVTEAGRRSVDAMLQTGLVEASR